METRRQRELKEQRAKQNLGRRLFNLGRTILILLAALVLTYLAFTNNWLTPEMFYQMGVPQSVTPLFLMIGVGFLILVVLNLITFLLMAWLSPSSRRRAGKASLDEY